ncbi:unnamed protein product [Camellia sinensis]
MRIWLCPTGDSRERAKSLSLFLELDDMRTFPTERKIYVNYTLLLGNQYTGQHVEQTAARCFSASIFAWGRSSFLSLTDLHDASKGILVNDTLIVEAKVNAISTVKNFS